MQLKDLKLHELEELQLDIDDRIRVLKREEWEAKKHTKEEVIAMFTGFGIEVPKGVKIWRIRPRGDSDGGYGMEVGKYIHSCHIETTDFIVLYVISSNGKDHDVESFSDHWLSDPFTV